MSSFTDPIEVSALPDGTFRLGRDIYYHIGREDSGLLVCVQAGFITDFASVPRLMRWLIDTVGRHSGAALLHDWLYGTHKVSKVVADAVFLEAMRVAGVTHWRRMLMYWAVFLFGGASYKSGPRRLKNRCPALAGQCPIIKGKVPLAGT